MATKATSPTSESYVEHSPHATVCVGPDAVAMFAAFSLASGLKLYARTGIKPNRAWTRTAMLAAATKITGKPYGRGRLVCMQAAEDVQKWATEMRAALPHIERGGK